jgi:hypothetical protein
MGIRSIYSSALKVPMLVVKVAIFFDMLLRLWKWLDGDNDLV